MTAGNPNLIQVPESRDEYVRQFARLARAGLAQLLADPRLPRLPGGRLEDFRLSGDTSVAAEATIAYRGRRFRYRRHIWPPDFPLEIKVALYVTHLQEMLLTGRYPGETGQDPTTL